MRDSERKIQVCKSLCLKAKEKRNLNHHKNLFAAMVNCDDTQFVAALRIFASEYDTNLRNDRLFALYGFTLASPVKSQDEELTRAMYINFIKDNQALSLRPLFCLSLFCSSIVN